MFTRRHILQGAGLAVLALALGACSGSGGGEDLRGSSAVLMLPFDSTPYVDEASRASAHIAWELMSAGANIRTTNAAMSPSSLAVTLAMLAEGASGNSLSSLDEAFGLTGDDRAAAVGALRQAVFSYEVLPEKVDAKDPPKTPVVHQANRVVILDDAEIVPVFLDRLSNFYDTGAIRLPSSAAKANLDAWAKKHTAGLIKKSAIEITPNIRLVTQDAVLFAARWQQEFSRDDSPLTFTNGSGASNEIEALSDSFTIAYASGPGWQAIRLPYDDVLAMDVVLPESGLHPSEFTFDSIHESVDALAQAERQAVDVVMPPSDIKTTWDLLEPLQDIGIDLSTLDGIFSGATTLQFAQQVRLMVTAKGTVGAALTEVAVGESAPAQKPVAFVVDRPFVMRVLDTRTGWPFFVAIVNDPADKPE